MSSLDILLRQIEDPSQLSWKDETYDLALAREVTGSDRDRLLARLIDAARADDPRAVLTLGYIGAVETLPALLSLARANHAMAANARRAVVLLGHGKEVLDLIAQDAVSSPIKMERVAAVMDLAKLGGNVAIDALLQALADEEFEVRELAWQGLVTVLGLDPLLRSPEGTRELMTFAELYSVWATSDLPALRKMGVEALRELFQKARRTASPAGFKWLPCPAPDTFQKIRLALFDADAAYPLDEIKPLTGSPRQWAETMILLRLKAEDPRVPAAMVQLGAEWTVPILDEVAKAAATTPELRAALEESIRALQAS
jgi:hypothetical protein